MKALYVTDRGAIGEDAFWGLLDRLRSAPSLTVQLREKTISDRDVIAAAARARKSLGDAVPLFVNRRWDIALAAGADGVHLPAEGLPLRRVKASTPRGFRVGASTHSAVEAIAAIAEGADLVVIGPIFQTPSKLAMGSPLGTEELAKLPSASEHGSEVYAIGGIDASLLERLAAYGDRIAGVAGIRLFQEARDPRGIVARVADL